MFTEKIKTWKQITAGFAMFGFILSFITGLIGSVGFGAVILRAFIFAVIFGGTSMVIMYLIDTFIPELLNPYAGEDSDVSDSAEIIEDDAAVSESGGTLNGVNLDITIEDDSEDDASPVREFEQTESSDTVTEPVEELEEVEAAESDDSDDFFNGAETSRAAKNGNGADMPDIGEFADSFDAAEIAGNSEGLSSIDGMGSSSGAEILGEMHDTQDIVKAVKTVLKKDQEG